MKIPKNFYILMDIEKALRRWKHTGKRNTFGDYCRTLELLGYRLLIALFLVGVACPVWAEIPKDKAVDCIIGEAENQGVIGMAAIAHALRNRGTVNGCYGTRSKRVLKRLYSSKTFVQAVKAWEDSRTGADITQGATGWGNKSDVELFKRTKWFKKCIITVKIGDHYFYKEIKR